MFIQTSVEGDDHDMLTATLGTDDNSTTSTATSDNSTTSTAISENSTTSTVTGDNSTTSTVTSDNFTTGTAASDNSTTSTATSENSITSMASEDNLITGAVVRQKDDTYEEQSNNQNMRTVCLIQAVRIPIRHQKMVKVKVIDECSHNEVPIMFESCPDISERQQVLVPSTITYLDGDGQFTLVLENHACQTVYFQPNQELGHVEDVVVCQLDKIHDVDDTVLKTTVNTLLVEPDMENTTANTNEVTNEKWITRLMETLTIHEASILSDQMVLLRKLLEDYSDIFALDATELGSTNLVMHSIDTGDSPPIRQPVRHVPFALYAKMEQLVQDMMK